MVASRADHAFDLVAGAYLVRPDLFSNTNQIYCSVKGSGPHQGQVFRSDFGGRLVKVVCICFK
jgi:hypothetical protein